MNTDIVMNNTTEATPSVAVKVTKGEEMRRFNFKGQSFQELKKIIAEIFSIGEDDFSLQYEDDEKDKVTLSSDSELKEAIQIHKYVLRFFVVVTKSATGETNAPLSPFHPYPHPYHHHHHHHRHHHAHPPHGAPVMAVEGDATGVPPPPPFGRHGRPFGPFPGPGPHRHHGHGPHGHHKRRFEKEEKEAMKCERKRWKKQRKCESSSSEDEANKLQKKEMRQLMKATKQSIKANWAPVKEANPAQWPENRELMIAEIKLAKRIIREQANNKPASPAAAAAVVVATEQTSPVVPTGVEMQA